MIADGRLNFATNWVEQLHSIFTPRLAYVLPLPPVGAFT
jgi:hypothetical protein